MERAHEAAAVRVQNQQAALFALLKSGISTAEPATAWQALTEAAARTLAVGRASIWLLGEDREELRLVDLYDRAKGRHATGTVLEAKRYPAYFHALRWSRAIVAEDAASDARTREFGEGYLGAQGIVSMLDAGIWKSGEARGVLCLESVGERRAWTADEQQFAGSIADLAAAVLVHDALRAARARADESEALFTRAFRSSPDWISIVRIADGRILHVNAGFERLSGYRAAEVVGRTSLETGLWADPAEREVWIGRILKEGSVHEHEVRFRTKSGEIRHFQLSGERVELLGEPCVVTVSRDVTERKRQEMLLYEVAQGVAAETGESFFRSLVEHLARVLGADLAFVGEIDASDGATVRTIAVRSGDREAPGFAYALPGSPCEQVVGSSVCAFPSGVARQFPEDRGLAEKGIEAYVGAPLRDSRGGPLGLIAVLFRRPLDDSRIAENLLRIFATRASGELECRQQVRALEHLAHHDSLTGLPNRIRLKQRVEGALASPGGRGAGTLLLIDLDRFKEINDTLGHHVGDVLLAGVARRLEAELCDGSGCEVARLGGDEFAIWLPEAVDLLAAERSAGRALAALTAPFEVGGYRLEVGASIGIAIAPVHADSPSGLLRCADVAMYAAKRRGASFAAYDPAEDPYTAERLMLLTELGEAVRHGQMEVHYQPRVRLADGRPLGFEALVRWRHPRLGLLAPSRFVPLAELSDLIRPLTAWVLREAIRQQLLWRAAGHPVGMAVNLSARQLVDESSPELIGRTIAELGMQPAALELEITESAIISDPERASATLRRIRELGVEVAVDDFGTGFSSLSHLKRLPLSALKIDVSFVGQMLTSAADRAIVESTIHLAHDLGLKVIAEGIEDEATLAALRAQGCDEGQGYLIGRPMPAAAATAWLTEKMGTVPI